MKPETLLETLDAGMLSKYVQSDDFPQYGGILLQKPPGSLGSTAIATAAAAHSDALVLSDLTLPGFKIMRDDFVSGRYTAMGLLELDKIYARQQSTAMNLEGLIKGLVEEGFRHFATEDQRLPSLPTRAHVQAAMTTALARRNFERWSDNGFSRRFLWITFKLADSGRITQAVHEWKRIDLGTILSKRPANGRIPYTVTAEESKRIQIAVKEQPGGNATAYALLKKIYCVWKWKFPEPKNGSTRAKELLLDLAPALSHNGDDLIL